MSQWSIGQSLLRSVATAKRLRVQDSEEEDGSSAFVRLRKRDPCIVALHPHGRYPMNLFPWLASRSDLFGNLVVAQSSLGKYVPTVGLVTMVCSVVDVTRAAIMTALEKRKHVALFPGGAREMVLCQPFSKTIPLVKHEGFLRLAYNAEGRRPEVVPCFLFGMHDAYQNPLARLDASLFNRTGINLPLWLPTRAAASTGDKVMVFGSAVDPYSYSSEEAFTAAYWASLEKAFESNKSRFPLYVSRSIQWVEVSESKKKLKKEVKGVAGHKMVANVSLVFTCLILVAAALSGFFWRMSTYEQFTSGHAPALAAHIVSTIVWTFTSANLTIKGYHRYHRKIGWVATLANIGMSGSAYHLSVASFCDVLRQHSGVAEPLSGHLRVANTAFHAFSNMQIAGVAPLFISLSITAVRYKDRQTHQRFMAMGHILIGVNFLPRVWMVAFRLLLPFLGNDTNFSLACLFQWYTQLSAIRQSKTLRRPLVVSNAVVALSSVSLLVLEHQLDFPNLSSVVGPTFALIAGAAMYILMLRENDPLKKAE